MHKIALILALGGCACSAAIPALMPLPRSVAEREGKLNIDGSFGTAMSGYHDARIEGALARLKTRILRQTGIIPIPGAQPGVLLVECAGAGPEYPTLGEDESYTLDVASTGAHLKAPTVTGALRGLATFEQLVQPGAEGFEVRGIHIEDRPRFPWRGLMLDVSRHWMPLEVVKRNLDAMAAVKLNVFHWHLSDDQGFRVESHRYPKLQDGSDGNFYTQDQIREVVAYARDRGIRVIPEFDMPGHTTSWFVGYPELASAPGPYEIGRHFGVFDPAMDPTREETYAFLDGFIGEMAPLFPDPYFHVGGDEVNGKQWKASASIMAFAKAHGLADDRALQVYFNQRLLKIVEKHGKIMVGWDEILHPDLPKAAVIQSWRGQKSLAEAAVEGYRGILSWGYYLDHLSPAAYHYGIDPLAGATAQLTPEQAERVLGGEACMWSELVTAETVDSRVWPRTAAIAERFWSAADVKDVDSMYDRMAAIGRELAWTGLEHRAEYGPMLDRLAGERPMPPLRVLADASEALGLGPRRGGRYTTLMPLNRFVDAARPESESVMALERAAARLAAGSGDASTLAPAFRQWADNDRAFQPLAEGDALLLELRPLSKDLSELGAMGLEALEYLGGKTAPADWAAAQLKEIQRIARPNAEVTLAAFRPVKVLVEAVARKGR